MSVITIGVIGKGNHPLYLRDFTTESSSLQTSSSCDHDVDGNKDEENVDKINISLINQEKRDSNDNNNNDINDKNENDPFSYFFDTSTLPVNNSASLYNQFLLHSALDKFDDISVSKIVNKSGGGTTTQNSMWVGLLCSIEGVKVYGYITNTKIKFMASVLDDDCNGKQQYQFARFAKESGIKALLASIHELYVEYALNPFSNIKDNHMISSSRFDEGVYELVQSFDETYALKDIEWK